ncbi:MAG: outer membrane lipoprotein chaperone LolA [Rhodocyclaceae bacterium]|nr:outer membrane lipoprotein chaperone LolA [Rhodocyclaceae bacterium]
MREGVMMRRLLLASALALVTVSARADAVDRLRAFLETTKLLRADFTQTVMPKNGRKPQFSSGSMAIARPHKFRWQIEKPYPQLIVGDGEKVWLHDPELNQVTVKKQGAALAGSPAALLAGEGIAVLEKSFVLKDAGLQDGLEWLDATPKNTDSGFEKVRIGFAGAELRAMELTDSFGQQTSLQFSKVEKNPALAASTFRFVPPKGADVLGD